MRNLCYSQLERPGGPNTMSLKHIVPTSKLRKCSSTWTLHRTKEKSLFLQEKSAAFKLGHTSRSSQTGTTGNSAEQSCQCPATPSSYQYRRLCQRLHRLSYSHYMTSLGDYGVFMIHMFALILSGLTNSKMNIHLSWQGRTWSSPHRSLRVWPYAQGFRSIDPQHWHTIQHFACRKHVEDVLTAS